MWRLCCSFFTCCRTSRVVATDCRPTIFWTWTNAQWREREGETEKKKVGEGSANKKKMRFIDDASCTQTLYNAVSTTMENNNERLSDKHRFMLINSTTLSGSYRCRLSRRFRVFHDSNVLWCTNIYFELHATALLYPHCIKYYVVSFRQR